MKIRRNILDTLFSLFIRLRAGGKCEYCGKPKTIAQLQCSHFHSRRKLSTRYDPDNCAALCFTCHQHMGENPYKHTEWFRKRLGTARFEGLNIRAEIIQKKLDKDELKTWLKEQIKVLEG